MQSFKMSHFLTATVFATSVVVSSLAGANTIHWVGPNNHRVSTYPAFDPRGFRAAPKPVSAASLVCRLDFNSEVEPCLADPSLNVGDVCFCYEPDGTIGFRGSVFAE